MANPVPSPSREPATRVWLVLWKAAHAIEQNATQSLSALGLGRSDFAVLEVLLHKGPQPVNIIGRKGSAHERFNHCRRRSPRIEKTNPEDVQPEGPSKQDCSAHQNWPAFDRTSLPKTCARSGRDHGRVEIRRTGRTGPLAQEGGNVGSREVGPTSCWH